MAAPLGNKYALGNNGGRPPKFKTAKALETKIIEYFEYVQGEKQVRKWIRKPQTLTVTGLALYLGFSSRKGLIDYKAKEEFCNIIKRAVAVVEESYEQRLSGTTATGAIFALKNMGWQDKTQSELSGPDGKPIQTESNLDVSKLSNDVLLAIAAARTKKP